MTSDQEKLIDEAIADRRGGNLPLENLTFALTGFNDDGLELLADKNLHINALFLVQTAVTDFGVRSLAQLPYLRKLDVSGTRVTAGGLEPLIRTANSSLCP